MSKPTSTTKGSRDKSLPYNPDLRMNLMSKYAWIMISTLIIIMVGTLMMYQAPKTATSQSDWNYLYLCYIVIFGLGIGGFFINGYFWNRSINKRDKENELNKDKTSKLPITSGDKGN